jgi:hypothetical protein
MKSFVVMFQEPPATLIEMSPSDMQAVIARYSAWFDGLRASGHLGLGAKLKDDGGQHLRRSGNRVIASDGPFAEAKDIVSGFFILTAASYEDAVTRLADCPHFDFGWTELREIEYAKEGSDAS